ncbi:MAG: glycosyltransferase family 4 protein [Candidatus Limnocylindrales bacterium]
MRVLHIVTKIGLGGAERVAETLSLLAAEEGISSAVLAVAQGPRDDTAAKMRSRLEAAGIELIQASQAHSNKRAALLAAPAIAGVVRRWRPDVVHLHTEVPEFSFTLARFLSPRTWRCPTVRTIHNAVFWADWAVLRWLVRWALRDARAVAVGEDARAAFRAVQGRPDAPCDLVVNGVILEGLLPRTAVALARPPRYLFAGRFEAQKGVDTLLDALDLLEGTPPTFGLTIMGAGGMGPEVRRRMGRLSRDVELRPPSGALEAELRGYDALVMPSRFEGLGLLAVEALCVGLPVLATAAPGLLGALPEDYPGRCPPGDPAALARLLAGFEADPSPWLGRIEADRTWARARYDGRLMARRYAEIYRQVVMRRLA